MIAHIILPACDVIDGDGYEHWQRHRVYAHRGDGVAYIDGDEMTAPEMKELARDLLAAADVAEPKEDDTLPTTPVTCDCDCDACHGLTLDEHCGMGTCRSTALLVGSRRESERRTNKQYLTLSTVAELNALPVGSIVMALWDDGPIHHVMQKYTDGWYGFPSSRKLFPLGSGKQGEQVALLWRG